MSKSVQLTCLIILLTQSFTLIPVSLAAEVYFDITAGPSRKIDIAVPFFSSVDVENEALKEEIHKIFLGDLEFSGRFNVIDISRFFSAGNTELKNPDFRAWYLVGVQSLVTGHIQQVENEYEVSMRLFDVPMGQQVVGKKYHTSLSGIRGTVHKFSDEIQFRLTGERGINFSRIAFTSNRTGHTELYTVDPDGANLTQLTRNGTINLSPAWSPDGLKIYYTSYLNNRPDLYCIDLNDQSSQPVLEGGMNITPCLSPKGDTLILSMSFSGNPEIVKYSLESKKIQRMTFNPGVESNPVFAPNGREIAFVSDRNGNPQIYLMNIDGTNVRRLTKLGVYNTSPDWSPRGDWIAYHSRREGFFNIWLIHPDGTDEHPITSEAGHNEEPTFARDGRHLSFVSSRSGGKSLYVMDLSGRSVKPVLIHHGACNNPSWSR
jgi:TolB protein